MTLGNEVTVGSELAAVLPVLEKPWYRTAHLLRLNTCLLFVTFSATGMGFDGSMMNGLESLSTWNSYFNNPSSSLLGTCNGVLNLGPIVFGGLVSWLADRFGRRKPVIFGCMVIILATVLQTAAQNFGMFIAARFLLGIGIEFCMVPSPVLATELAYPTHRAKFTSLLYTFYFVGAIVSSWTTYDTSHMNTSSWSWRIPSLLQLVLPTIQLVAFYWVPESPRWLISKGRVPEARAILVKHHADGDEDSALVNFEIQEIQHYLRVDADSGLSGWSQIWKTKADKKRLALVVYISFMSQWCGNGVVSYYLSLILDTVGMTSSGQKTLINGLIQIVGWISAIIGGLLVDRVGRRPLWLTSICGMLAAYTAWTVFSSLYASNASHDLAIAVLALIFVFQVCYSIVVTPLCTSYPVEIPPFHSRQKVMGLAYMGNSCANLFNSFVSPVALTAISWRYYIVYIALLTQFLVVVYLFFPETRGHGLEQISDLFESEALLSLFTRKVLKKQS
ncbi:general substrate transporter [Aspergillus sclerotiicarbonarius CBS 121057]|uniref:General substrate transporter n=1 Tax=Aspergillus sclerotiicarbonarius (strain CBS 121057 / IBT 28362) TaxID=1448318 RepID=A0A319EG32_ASPSB|nr:general substrate transporter [Aspergillus sclerotiicarbonarius CBS 121057]